MVPSKTAEEMGEEEGNTSAGCCIIPPVLSLVGKAFNGDAKDDETMEERKKVVSQLFIKIIWFSAPFVGANRPIGT